MTSLADSAARGAAATMTGQAFRFGLQLLSVSVLARLLSPDDYGVFAMVIAIVGLASILGDFGLSLASIQSQTITRAQRSNLFWTNFLIGGVLAAGVFALAEPIAAFYGRPELVDVTRATSAAFLLNALTAQFRAEVSIKLRFKWLAISDVLAQAIALAAAIVLAVQGAGYWALVAQQLLVAFVTLVVLVAGARWLPGLPRRGARMRSLYVFGANTLGVQVLTYATSNADNVLIGRFSGAAELGVYSRAYQIFRLPLQQIASPMTRVALPVLSKLQDDSRYDSYVQRAQLVLSYAFAGLFFVMAAVASPAIDLLLGSQWGGAKKIFAVLAVGGVFQALAFVYFWVYVSRAFTGLQLRFSIIGRILMLIMMGIGVLWGPLGVAIGSTLGQLTMWLLHSFIVAPRTGVDAKALVRLTFRPIVLYSGMVALALPLSFFALWDMNPVLHLLILGMVMAVYLGLAVWLIPGVRHDVSLIRDVAVRVRKRR